MTLSEYVVDIAILEAEKRLTPQMNELVCAISDEIIETAEVCNDN